MDTNLSEGVWHVGAIAGFGDMMAWQVPLDEDKLFGESHAEGFTKARYFTFYRAGPQGQIAVLPWFGYASGAAPLGEWASLHGRAVVWSMEADRDAKRKLDDMWGKVGAKSAGLSIVEGGKER